MPRTRGTTSTGAPARRRRARPTAIVAAPESVTTASPSSVTLVTTTSAGRAAQELGEFAARLHVGQQCEGGCGRTAGWAAVAKHQQRFACAEHLGGLLDRGYIWFLHPVGE